MKKKILIYMALFAFILVSCDDYLDVEPKGQLIPATIEDFDLLMVGGDYSIHTTSDDVALFLSADNTDPLVSNMGDLSSNDNLEVKLYRWDADLFPPTRTINLWNYSYKNIYTYNLIVTSIDDAVGNDDTAKKRIKAEARTMRAYEYYILVNAFAKQYNNATASQDPGVPVVTEPDVFAKYDGRKTVQEVYDFILADLNESVDYLPTDPLARTRPAKAAGYGLLARVYLQMGDYEKAKANASLALNENNSLGDYTSTSGYGLADVWNPEQYVNRYYGSTYGYTGGGISEEAYAMYNSPGDMRINGIWALNWRQLIQKSYYTYSNHCVSVPEMYVIRAECNARLANGSVEDVLEDLNTLRRNRIPEYADSTNVATKEAALAFAIDERRREMLSSGHRWFDLKRLNMEPAFAKTIIHVLEDETFTLEPNSSKYVFPIPAETMNFNPDMEQNIRE